MHKQDRTNIISSVASLLGLLAILFFYGCTSDHTTIVQPVEHKKELCPPVPIIDTTNHGEHPGLHKQIARLQAELAECRGEGDDDGEED